MNSFKFYLYGAKTIQLSQCALQSPGPEHSWSKHNGDRGEENSLAGRNLEQNHVS